MPECGVEKISHENILSYEEILRVANFFSKLGIKNWIKSRRIFVKKKFARFDYF